MKIIFSPYVLIWLLPSMLVFGFPSGLFVFFMIEAAEFLHEVGHVAMNGWRGTIRFGFLFRSASIENFNFAAIAGGPAFSLAASVVSYAGSLFLAGGPSAALFIFSVINLVCCVFNMIPLYPSDGSRIILALFPSASMSRFGFWLVPQFLTVLLSILAFVCGWWLLGLFFLFTILLHIVSFPSVKRVRLPF